MVLKTFDHVWVAEWVVTKPTWVKIFRNRGLWSTHPHTHPQWVGPHAYPCISVNDISYLLKDEIYYDDHIVLYLNDNKVTPVDNWEVNDQMKSFHPENLDMFPVSVEFIKEWLVETSLSLLQDTTVSKHQKQHQKQTKSQKSQKSSSSSASSKNRRTNNTGTNRSLSLANQRLFSMDYSSIASLRDLPISDRDSDDDSVCSALTNYHKEVRKSISLTPAEFEVLKNPYKKKMHARKITLEQFREKVMKNSLCLEIFGQVLPEDDFKYQMYLEVSEPFD